MWMELPFKSQDDSADHTHFPGDGYISAQCLLAA